MSFSKEGIKVYPKPDLKYFTFGYRNALADTLWLSYLQNSDYCENSHVAPTYNKGEDLDEVLSISIAPSRCHKGWVYQTLNSLTDIDPRFHSAYDQGGVVLAVAIDDREGAKIIFDKGLAIFPNDWVLNYKASYLYIYELQDAEKAAGLLMTAFKNGGPDYLPSLAARLYTKAGQALLGQSILEDFIKNNPDSNKLERAKERLKELRKNL